MEARPSRSDAASEHRNSSREGSVLLCYDGSGEADLAIRRASVLLRPRTAVVVHVRGRASAESVAAAGAEVALDSGFAPVSTVEIGGRRVAEAVLQEAHRRAVAMIVVGSAGVSATDSTLLGSVSSTLVHHADLPVLVVRPPDRLDDRGDSGPAFVCYDGSDEARAAILRAAGLLAGHQAVVASFLELVDDVVFLRTTLPWSAGAETQQRLARLDRGEAERVAVTAGEGAASAALAGFAARQVPIAGPGPCAPAPDRRGRRSRLLRRRGPPERHDASRQHRLRARPPCRPSGPGDPQRRSQTLTEAQDRCRWRANQSVASRATSSSAPGSSNRCVAPGMTTSSAGPASRYGASRLRSRTTGSWPPTISSTGAVAACRRGSARSGRPPRETTARIVPSASAVARSAAAAPVRRTTERSSSVLVPQRRETSIAKRHRRRSPPHRLVGLVPTCGDLGRGTISTHACKRCDQPNRDGDHADLDPSTPRRRTFWQLVPSAPTHRQRARPRPRPGTPPARPRGRDARTPVPAR